MKTYIIIIVALLVIGIFIFFAYKKSASKSGAPTMQDYELADIYMSLRNQAFAAKSASTGNNSSDNSPFGVIVEIGMDAGICTIVSFASGDASVYFSGGGGQIGGGGVPEVNKAAKNMVKIAESQISKMKLTTQCPIVNKGNVRVYVLFDEKIYYDEAPLATIFETDTSAKVLFSCVQNVLTGFRHHSESQAQ